MARWNFRNHIRTTSAPTVPYSYVIFNSTFIPPSPSIKPPHIFTILSLLPKIGLCTLILSPIVLATLTVYILKPYITYLGKTSNSIEHFQNIKFVYSASGTRPFAPPEPYIPPRDTVADASFPGLACPRSKILCPSSFTETKEISEDYIKLQITQPVGLDEGGRGVRMIPHFDPDNFIALSVANGELMICFVVQYRLSIFGFARLDLKSLNLGLRDQRVAFEWIKGNIGDFDGNENRITVFGLSAGGTSMRLQTLAELEDEDMLKRLREVLMEKLLYSVENHSPAGIFTFIRCPILYRVGMFVKDGAAIFAGPAHLNQMEEGVIVLLKSFAYALTPSHFLTLFSLNDLVDFEEDFLHYNASKSENDPEVSVHNFRLSRMLRGLLFTCSSIDFGYHMMQHSRLLDPNFPGVRLYALDQSMLTPFWKAAGMPYVGVSYGSDTNYIFNDVFLEGEVRHEDRRLSKVLVGSLIEYSCSGDPRVNVWVIGGPYGTGAVSAGEKDFAEYEEMNMQRVVQYGFEFREMKSVGFYVRKREIGREKLLKRCAYISSFFS
ncbi:alpha/beta-hydrolase [Zopfia rhizophila CBS 207.26]|uniref:Alpha/beta-hydrolase n=1 Tax=Zopfia rhizophila CBS 207.26 TaxID=1314779 RepID=A0A6A6DBT6_9PEZI|nr:alpha/beta-hydrolase [Zopfia rhizophila CBS 207.26]